MRKIGQGDYIISYDDELGVVCSTTKGRLKITNHAHAKSIKQCLEKYFQDDLTDNEKAELDSYMDNAFGYMPDLQLKPCPPLFERDTIRRLEILVANDCNLNCKYCYAHAGSYGRSVQRLDADAVQEYLSKLLIGKYTYVETVMFFGGEPTLCPDTIRAACEFFEVNVNKRRFKRVPQYTMVTNGTLIDGRMATIISKYGIRVTVSVDGPQEINDLLRVDKENAGTFSKIERGIKTLKEYNVVPALLEATFTTKHIEHGYSKNDIRDFLSECFEVRDVLVADCGEGGYDKSLVLREDQDCFDDSQKEYRLRRILSEGTFSDISCDAGFGSVALMPDGEVYPCHFFVEHPEYRVAFYDDGEFSFTNYNEVLRKLSSAHRLQNAQCGKCSARMVCHACPASLLLFESDDKSCEEERQNQEKLVLHCAREQIRQNTASSTCTQE